MQKYIPQLKIADMVSITGAAIMGLAIGGFLHEHLVGAISEIMILGLALHGLGMYGKFQIERQHINPPAWVFVAFMLCWILTMMIALYILIGRYIALI